MRLPRRLALRVISCGLIALVVALALAAAPLAAYPRVEVYAYYSVVHGEPYAAYTDLKTTSPYAYYSVVHGEPYAPYTDLKATSPFAYYSVVKDGPYAPYTDLKATSPFAYYSVVH